MFVVFFNIFFCNLQLRFSINDRMTPARWICDGVEFIKNEVFFFFDRTKNFFRIM